MANKFGVDLDTAISEIQESVEDAIYFMEETYSEDWETAERYMAGESDLPEYEGRSNVVKTEVRDAIRNVKPSFMRTMLHSRKIVEYLPTQLQFADWSEQQALYATQRFWACNGYLALAAAFEDAAKLKGGVFKTYWLSDPLPDYVHYSKVTPDIVQTLEADPDIDVFKVTLVEDDEDAPTGLNLYEVEAYKYANNGEIVIENIPLYEFFIDRNSTSIAESVNYGTHGQSRECTVQEALELGLDYDDWESLSDDDPEQSRFSGASYARRGYAKDGGTSTEDLTRTRFLLTEAYARFDLKGTGRAQLYRFWLGGTDYTYIDHEEVDESPFDLGLIDPIPQNALGRSLTDITIKEQDTNTSLLRATIDNAHAANNPRHASDPVRTKFEDLVSTKIGAPIRTRGDPAIQTVAIPFTGQGLLPLLQYMNQDVQEKVGYTKAAQGLDPNAMQSTDKDAVKNTIMLSQGQIELMVRNFAETALVPLFRKVLKLSMQHMPAIQLVQTKGKLIPIALSAFNPDAVAVPNVGLGTASPEQKVASLNFVLQKQEQIIQQFGMDNPFTSLTQMYNTMEDLIEASGLPNVGRYFNVVTPDIEKKLAEQQTKQAQEQAAAAKEAQPLDPSKAAMAIESGKNEVKKLEILSDQRKTEISEQRQAITAAAQADIERDKMVQNRVIELTKLNAQKETAKIQSEQKANDKQSQPIADSAGGKKST